MGPASSGFVPIYFGPAERQRFGLYHPAAGNAARALGVVLCNPVGDDLIRAHRTLRHMAEDLAAVGLPVLRFDFDGTGDSAGDERDPGRVAAWREDVRLAVSEIKQRAGVDRIALVGLKLGGTLAAAAAEAMAQTTAAIDALVLWGAQETGSAFVSEMTKAHQMHTRLEPQSFSGGPPSTEGDEALGFLLTPEVVKDLAALNLQTLGKAPARRALVVDVGNMASASAVATRLTALGSVVTSRHMPGQKFLITRPQDSEVPQAVIETIRGWLLEDAPPLARTPAAAATTRPPSTGYGTLEEAAVFFGGERRLFGILTSPPAEARRPDLPAIVILNAGSIHRIGAHRLHVPLARSWAELGFQVLRIDLSGIGDSPAAAGCPENLTYPRDGESDVQAAMDFLSETTGAQRFILAGHCSGGDITFQLGFKHHAVAGAVMINPRTFCVNDLNMVDSYEQARTFQGSLLQGGALKRLLQGDAEVARAVRIVAPKVKDQVVSRAKHAVSSLLGVGRDDSAAVEAPRENDVPRCLRLMAERGVDTFLIVSERDPGVYYVDSKYGPEMRALVGLPGYTRVDVKGTDHTFTARWAQDKVTATITAHLKQRFLTSRAA
jgi:alpha-beta hydrolase superfamily lysophospholipase